MSAVRRAPLAAFLVLACLLSWWPSALHAAGVPYPAVTGAGPFLAAVIVLAVTTGRPGVGRLLRSMVRWRVPRNALLAAIGLPLLVSGAAILGSLLLGAARPGPSEVALLANVPIVAMVVLLIPGIGGAWEEPGFRGYALGRFEARFGTLAGPLALGGFWVLWHGPLFLTGDVLWTDVPAIVAASVVIAALFHHAQGSVLVAMLFHATNNAVGGGFASQLFHGADRTTLGLLTAAGWWLIAGGIMLRARRAHQGNPAPVPSPRATPVSSRS